MGGSALARMFKRFRFYNSFVTNSGEKTLEDYVGLFRRSICVDIVLAVLYSAAGGIPIVATPQVLQAPIGIISSAALATVVLFWLLDAAFMVRFKRIVEAWSDAGEPPPELTTWFRICIVSATIGIVLYFIRLALEVATSVVVTHDIHSQWYTYVSTLCFAGLKIMRVRAVNSFSRWLSVTQSKKTSDPRQNTVSTVV